MKTNSRRTFCVALCTGYGANISISWTFFTHHAGFDSPAAALQALASELVVRFRAKQDKIDIAEGITPSKEIDPVRFISFINHLFRSSWDDYGDPDKVGDSVIKWWPFNEITDVLSFTRDEVIVVPLLAGEILLAAYDRKLLTDFDVKEICIHAPEIAKILDLSYIDRTKYAFVGAA